MSLFPDLRAIRLVLRAPKAYVPEDLGLPHQVGVHHAHRQHPTILVAIMPRAVVAAVIKGQDGAVRPLPLRTRDLQEGLAATYVAGVKGMAKTRFHQTLSQNLSEIVEKWCETKAPSRPRLRFKRALQPPLCIITRAPGDILKKHTCSTLYGLTVPHRGHKPS